MDEAKDQKLRDGIIDGADKALKIVMDYLNGNIEGSPKVEAAFKILGFGMKISHLNQLKIHIDRSQAIRLLPYISEEQRDKYIELTNPAAAPFLLDRPRKVQSSKLSSAKRSQA